MYTEEKIIFNNVLHVSVYKVNELISEKLVAHIWQQQLVADLVTDSGEKVCTVFSGRACIDGGGDFCDAILTIGDKTVKGNIEVHVRSSQWYSHGHHLDSNYNNVVLHVVMWHDCQTATVLQNGNGIPTIHLWHYLTRPLSKLNRRTRLSYSFTPSCPKVYGCFEHKSLIDVLNTTGKKRFIKKVTAFEKSLVEENAGQVLFRNISRALGYDKNTSSFEQLADMLPLRMLEHNGNDSVIHQALILGTAGLLPSQRHRLKRELKEDPVVAELEIMWQMSKIARTMNQNDWYFFRVHPYNFPTRRLVALSHLVSRYYDAGLLRSTLSLVRASPRTHAHQWIEDGLIIPAQGYWTNHIDFGITAARSAALLGQNKAAEIAVNIVLPFAYAWGKLFTDPKLREKALAIYLNYPKLGSNNLIRFMRQQLLIRPDANLSAVQQQGLIHIFKNYCRHRNCLECPIVINRA